MAVFQHYYTSYVNRDTGSAGFQVKAMSPGIAADTQSTITRLISYRIPPRLDEYALSTHPVALRYYYRNPQEAILLCSQSNGADENGRPGNFFAHSLVTEPEFFANMPPILYWRSNFWRTKDPGTSSVIEPIASLEEIETALDIEGVWQFLAQGERIEQFHKLMCAVVHAHSTQRRIVIIDDADNVAQWIAAISIMLPPDYRPLLSFATYHHDPYQSQFLVTGTTGDSSFRASPDEYLTYFILNTENGKISDVQGSPYADEAAEAARSYDIYDSKLLTLITDYMPRFPHPEHIDEQLDLLALYAGILAPNRTPALTPKELEAISVVLTTFEQTRREEDLDEVQQLSDFLEETFEAQGGDDVYAQYQRTVALLKHPARAALRGIKRITKHLINDTDLSPVIRRLSDMPQLYGEDLLIAVINGEPYLQWLSKFAADLTTKQLALIWQYLGVYLNPGPSSEPLVITSITTLDRHWNDKQTREAKRAFDIMIQAMRRQDKEWLQLIVASEPPLPNEVLELFYCLLVDSLPLDARLPYRAIMQGVNPSIDKAELRFDINKVRGLNALPVLKQWIHHAKRQRMASLPALLDEGLTRITKSTPLEQVPELAAQILVSRTLSPLPAEWENDLVRIALSQVSLSHFTPEQVELCERYKSREGLSADTRTIIDGLLAMKNGVVSEELAERLRLRYANVPPKVYIAEMESFLKNFLQVCRDAPSHQLMINTFFNWDYEGHFWKTYWYALTHLLTFASPSAAEQAAQLLSFWFTARSNDFTASYLLPCFFLDFPRRVERAQKEQPRGFKETSRYIAMRAEKEQWGWYELVRDNFSDRKNALQSMGHNLAATLRRGQDSEEARRQAQKEQRERMDLEERISVLFEKKGPRQQHARLMGEVYDWHRRELFWSIYWMYFKQLCTSANNAQFVLELFLFWFDDAFTMLRQKISIPQQFFLELHGVLMEVQKDRRFREFADYLLKIGMQHEQARQWFGLVQLYFVEQEKRSGFLKR